MDEPQEASGGCLYLVGTPLGNREDISARAVRILSEADLIACEDTRTSQGLLKPLGISRPLLAYHEHNELEKAVQIADAVASGKKIALITDAGMPAISDPGFRVVRECRRRGLSVIPIPGPTAAMSALAASGLPSDSFLFLGFLPAKTSARKKSFEDNRSLPCTIIYYESTHRIAAFVEDLIEVLGPDRCICIAREITKLHETFYAGKASEVLARLVKGSTKGEFVVMIAKEGYSLEG
ncbi:MAG TPA: 16S rRNA (cytidine(1402)-2'-O)-methyltransferase [Opitutales bacterium]|nr:16S rRNA (cytidine(1402)-2'-O)-methyltransferase [Opitutales bacterium]